MIELTDIKVYNSFFNITEENNDVELYKFLDSNIDGVSYEKFRDDIERDLEISDNTSTVSQDETIGPNIIDEHTKQVTKEW